MNWRDLFDPQKADQQLMFRGPDWSAFMPIGKFDRIRKWAHAAFASPDVADPWGLFRPFVTEYNAHMMELIEYLHDLYWIPDESMSPLKPRSDKYGGLPNLSYIQRKPMPYGTEFKTVCTSDGLLVFIEIQEGAGPMRALHIDGYGSKASMTVRLCENAAPGMTVIGDSDFGSLAAAHALARRGKGCIMNVKTSHAGFPKDVLHEKLTGCAAGSYIVMTTTVDGIRFNAIGYKYARSKKAQTFICTVGAVTSGWKPYIAKFKDAQFNTVSRPVRRPNVLSRAYELLNTVDKHNHGRQDLIHVERSWLSKNCWFRLFCTGMGIVAENTHRHHNNVLSVKQQLTHDVFLRNLSSQLVSVSELKLSNGTVLRRKERPSSPSGMSMALVSSQTPGGMEAPRSMSPELATFDGNVHTQQRVTTSGARHCAWCSHLHGNQTRRGYFECKECNVGLCASTLTNGRQCFNLHKKHGIPPKNMQAVDHAARQHWGHIKADDLKNAAGYERQPSSKSKPKRKRKRKGKHKHKHRRKRVDFASESSSTSSSEDDSSE
jgi:hypothetical protein